MSSYNDFMAEFVPLVLQSADLFQASFYSKIAASFLACGRAPAIEEADLLPGVDLNQAGGVLNQRIRVVSGRFHNSQTLEQMKSAGVRFVELKVSRACPGCPRVPKPKKYKPGVAPVFPCMTCTEDVICDVWYKAVF